MKYQRQTSETHENCVITRLQRTGTSNTKLLYTELVFLHRFINNPRLSIVFPKIAVTIVLQKVGEKMKKMPT